MSALIYTNFDSGTTNGFLDVNAATILPNGSDVFDTSIDEIIINEPGSYEVAISGVLSKVLPNETAIVILQLTKDDSTSYVVTIVQATSELNDIFFSRMLVYTLEKKNNVKILF